MCSHFKNALALVVFIVSHVMADDGEPVRGRLPELLVKLRSAESIAGRTEAAKHLNAEIDKVGALKATDLTIADLEAVAESCQACRRYEEAVRYAKAAIEVDPMLEVANTVLIKSLVFLKRLDDAIISLEKAKNHVSPESRVRGLHSIIYFNAAAARDWQKAFSHIEAHLAYLARATQADPAATVHSYFWVDQFALACKKTDSDHSPSQQQIDLMWEKLAKLEFTVRPPLQGAQVRDRCAVLELQSAIEVHTNRRMVPDRLSEWTSTIATMGQQLNDAELEAEAMLLGQFLRDHQRDLDGAKKVAAIQGVRRIQFFAAFRVAPSLRINRLQASLEQVCQVLAGAELRKAGDAKSR